MDKVIQQRKMSAPIESVTTSSTTNTNGDCNSKPDHVEEVDHPVMAGNRSSGTGNSSESPSVERDVSGDSGNHQQVTENGDHDKVAEKTPSTTVVSPPPQPITSPPVLQGRECKIV